jgi:N-acyl-D-amino-acid deacylase
MRKGAWLASHAPCMTKQFDLVIANGTVVDGIGGGTRVVDVGINGGRISAIGDLSGRGLDEIDATGNLVTPGFIDIHTHYDGQVTWDNRVTASSAHGVTTVIMGNCGVGFAPCRAADRDALLGIMEGVEDIPEAVMAAGVPWNWESFPDYLDALAVRRFDIDIGAQLPHSALRLFVMGKRGAHLEAATDDDKECMAALARDAASHGAFGFATSRNTFHATRDGSRIPSFGAHESELLVIANGLRAAGAGVLQVVPSFEGFDDDFAIFKRLVEQTGRPLSFSILQIYSHPDLWRHALRLTAEANAQGLPIRAQVIGRPTGILVGLDLSYNPFSYCRSYQSIANRSLKDRVSIMRHADFKRRLLAEEPEATSLPILSLIRKFETMFLLDDPPDYEPLETNTIAARASSMGITPAELAYDLLLESDGRSVLFCASANYIGGNLDAALEMIKDPHTILALGDGGAHYGLVCDSGYPSFMLSYWCRDRQGEKISIGDMVRKLTSVPATAVGLHDRGQIRVGFKADLNVIDLANLRLHAPRAHYDLPAGGRRVMQAVDGIEATIVNGVCIRREGLSTSALPGRLIRSQAPS